MAVPKAYFASNKLKGTLSFSNVYNSKLNDNGIAIRNCWINLKLANNQFRSMCRNEFIPGQRQSVISNSCLLSCGFPQGISEQSNGYGSEGSNRGDCVFSWTNIV
jgi:hypothetical protein